MTDPSLSLSLSLSLNPRDGDHNRCGETAASDTNPLDGGMEGAFSATLQRRGLDTFVVPVERSDWLNLASAILTLDFWKGTCRPDGPAYSWYLDKVGEEARQGGVNVVPLVLAVVLLMVVDYQVEVVLLK